jgi:hypothetical protein
LYRLAEVRVERTFFALVDPVEYPFFREVRANRRKENNLHLDLRGWVATYRLDEKVYRDAKNPYRKGQLRVQAFPSKRDGRSSRHWNSYTAAFELLPLSGLRIAVEYLDILSRPA